MGFCLGGCFNGGELLGLVHLGGSAPHSCFTKVAGLMRTFWGEERGIPPHSSRRVWTTGSKISNLSYQAQDVDTACVARYLRISVTTRARARTMLDTKYDRINLVLC